MTTGDVLLLVTHLLAAVAGGCVTRYFILRRLEVCEVDGHPALEFRHDPDGHTGGVADDAGS